jgi:hypothetical protein
MQEAAVGPEGGGQISFDGARARMMARAELSLRSSRSHVMQNRPNPAEPQEPPVKDPQPYKDPIKPPPGDPQEDRPLHDPVPPDKDQPRI